MCVRAHLIVNLPSNINSKSPSVHPQQPCASVLDDRSLEELLVGFEFQGRSEQSISIQLKRRRKMKMIFPKSHQTINAYQDETRLCYMHWHELSRRAAGMIYLHLIWCIHTSTTSSFSQSQNLYILYKLHHWGVHLKIAAINNSTCLLPGAKFRQNQYFQPYIESHICKSFNIVHFRIAQFTLK